MASTIQFNDTNINNYQDIPSSIYPTLTTVALTEVTVNHSTTNVVNGILPDNLGVFVTWKYPVTDDLYYRTSVGYQLQVIEGTFTDTQCQSYLAPGTIVYESIINLKTEALSEDRYINLQGGAKGTVNIPPTAIIPGSKYTVRIRALLFSELGDGTLGEQYFKYTKWGTINFRINNVPSAINLKVNDLTNPTSLPKNDHVYFSFTFLDTDGPSYSYRIQVGTTPGVGFTANVWDSNLIAAGSGYGSKDITIAYAGTTALSSNVTYAWRVQVDDGLSDGGWTAATDTFKINSLPTVSSLTINGQEILFGTVPTIGSTGAVLAWTFSDTDGDTQKAYNLTVVQKNANQQPGSTSPTDSVDVQEILVTGNVFNSTSSINLPDLPDGGEIEVSLKVRDSIEFGDVITAEFTANAKPQVLSLTIDGAVNPGNVSSPLPTFGWVFFDSTPGDLQTAFRIQVATNDAFTTLLWDTGNITSAANSVQYGSTAFVVAPVPLTHGAYYYVRVSVSDGTSFSDYTNGFFAINTRPNSPTILTPTALSYDGIINVTWLPAQPLDNDGDTVTYTLEMTNRRSSNQGWEYLTGPIASVAPTVPNVEYTILVCMDGVRVSESFDTPANIPNISNLINLGAKAIEFYDGCPKTETISGHDAMLTGFYEDISNTGSESPTYPSFLSEWLYNKGIISTSTSLTDRAKLIASKDKLWCLRKTQTSSIWDNYTPYFNTGVNGDGTGGYRSDALTHALFKTQCLGTTPPNVSMVSYASPDTAAHASDWAGYIAAIQQIDAYIGEIWTLVQAHPLMANKTTLVITNDHGRQADPNFNAHGGTTELERRVMFVAVGPRVKEAFTTATTYGLKDIPATIMRMMDMSKSTGNGIVMTDIIESLFPVISYSLDTAQIKSGNDYGIRVLANDGFIDSTPTLGTSPVNSRGLGFTIKNHNPVTPVFISPITNDIAASILKVEWLEADPVDIDGDSVFYILEMTRDASVGTPTYEKIGVYNQGSSRCFIDISNLADGSNYKLRITAQDDKGGIGAINYSGTFSIINTPAITDFETLGTTLYLSTTDGRIFKANESIWELEEHFSSSEEVKAFEEFKRGTPVVGIENGTLVINSPPGSTYILRVGNKIN